MDVTPPSTLRRLGIALAGLAVAALTGAACALSFDDLRALAITGEARQDLAFLYPAAFDALLVVALIDVLLLRSARLLVRVQAAFVLVVLIVAAAAANVATAVRFVFDVRQAAVGVALAPWVMLAVALWLWLLLIKHVQSHRAAADHTAVEQDIIPFHPDRPAAETPPPPPQLQEAREEVQEAPEEVVQAVPEAPAVAAQVAAWPVQHGAEPQPRRVQHDDEEPQPRPAQHDEEPQPRPVQQEQEEERPRRPMRWGDRIKPTDVLVHPRADDKDADTQPHPVVTDDAPDPGHGPELADVEERDDESADTAPHPVIRDDDTPAPSGRLRSTPRPPEDPED
ncbi:DUF2637 domain-containing protein [Nonomuraea sp. NPDC049400]|uniref:DUF2637 domain-containing protein n=1 Tax=Nonomuraea sp. NPDC049400 TaxID=3364352 RepID=UPI0037BE0EF1